MGKVFSIPPGAALGPLSAKGLMDYPGIVDRKKPAPAPPDKKDKPFKLAPARAPSEFESLTHALLWAALVFEAGDVGLASPNQVLEVISRCEESEIHPVTAIRATLEQNSKERGLRRLEDPEFLADFLFVALNKAPSQGPAKTP